MKNKIRNRIIALNLFQVLDYMLTWIGVRDLKIVLEANPLMVWQFEMAYIDATITRVLFILIIGTILLILLEVYSEDYSFLNIVVYIGLVANIFVHLLHYRWIETYLSYNPKAIGELGKLFFEKIYILLITFILLKLISKITEEIGIKRREY